jgi:prepilin signal peptidase PulO-like enzyme (type II secretory pathway)
VHTRSPFVATSPYAHIRFRAEQDDDVNGWLALDAGLRTGLAALVGLVLGAVVNWAVSSLAYDPRSFSPWSRKHPRDDFSPWADRLPLAGWWRLRRKSDWLGRCFWIRPLVVEITMTTACAALYWWEVRHGKLLPRDVPAGALVDPAMALTIHLRYVGHVLLLAFMLAASLIDADEMTIPDSITVPGTLVGLAFITAFPWALLPIGGEGRLGTLMAAHGYDPVWIGRAFPNAASLVIGCGCWWLWCGGLLPRRWRTSRGLRRAVDLLAAHIRRDPSSWKIGLLAVVGTALIAIVWTYDQVRWLGLGTSLVGVATGGAIAWIVRNVGTWALGREALGFGDVTLMSMIGAFLGWQACVLVFFTAPLAALVIGGLQWLFLRNSVLPYGPFLCLATAVVVTGWSPTWRLVGPSFGVPWLVPAVLAVGFVLLGLILALLRALRGG